METREALQGPREKIEEMEKHLADMEHYWDI